MILLATLAPRAAGQTCFLHPAPSCPNTLVTEVGIARPQPATPEDYYALWQAGYLRAITPRVAVGVVGWLGAGEDLRAGVRARLRFWATDHVALDLSPGGVLLDGRYGAELPGFAGEASVVLSGWGGAFMHLESVPNPTSMRDTWTYWGLKLEGVPGAGTGVVGAMLAGLLYWIGRMD